MTKVLFTILMLLATVSFAYSQHTITATANTGGTITPSGDVSVANDANQSFTITPDMGYHTDSVLIDGVNWGILTTHTFDTVHTNHTISAFFTINSYEITATAGTGGTINPSGSVWVNYDANQNFTITANNGYAIDSVVVDGANMGSITQYSFDTVHTTHTISAYFKLMQYEIEASATQGGTISPSGSTWVFYGMDTTYTISPFLGYQIDSVLVDNMNQGAITMYTFNDVDESHTIFAYFSKRIVTVTFNADMTIKAKKGTFIPTEDTVFVSGTFNSWEAGMMNDNNGDSIYSYSISAHAGDTITFKYRYWDYSEAAFVWESDPNRMLIVTNEGATYTDVFNRDSVYVEQYNIEVFFSVDMELERLSGRFHPGTDTVSVNGSFNGWATKTTILSSNGLNPDLYQGSTVVSAGLGESIEFKFWYEDNNWESVDNRKFTFADSNITSLTAEYSASFNNGTLENVLNNPCVITFTCNTVGAKSAISNNAFSAVNSVSIAGSALPLKWPGGGWPDADSANMSKLFDDGTHGDLYASDGIFTTQLTIPAYTVLSVQYKYSINFADAANNEGGNDNENGFGNNHILSMSRFLSSATTVDTFGVMGTTIISNPTSVREDGVVPATYSLSQNYPNPFNPSTVISYAIPVQGVVTLHVYNTLGQQVATLVNEMQEAGNYHVTFATNNLPTGLYYYRIITNNFTDTKSMLLVK